MSRRQRVNEQEDHENHERWLVSYADFITLLFAFFVVMYALSSINEGKYRILSNSLTSAFRNAPVKTESESPTPQLPQIPQIVPIPNIARPSRPAPATANSAIAEQEKAKQAQREKMKNMAQEIMSALAPLVQQGKVRLLETSRGITIEIADSALFGVGQAVLTPESRVALRIVAQVIAGADFPVTIEGHTDNVPINTAQFPSNWELSAVRATTVLRIFAEVGVPPNRLTAIGYGETRPLESNDSIEGRARNRRVSIQIESWVPEMPTVTPLALPSESQNDASSNILQSVPSNSPENSQYTDVQGNARFVSPQAPLPPKVPASDEAP